jgi:epsilon-lactone hydrolase
MASMASRLTKALLRVSGLKHRLARQWVEPGGRKPGEGRPPKSFYQRFRLTETVFQGRPVYELAPQKAPVSPKHILYLHGGAFISNANRPNWELAARLVEATGATLIAPDYLLAPEHRAPAVFHFVRALYAELLTVGGVAPQHLTCIGDSAGASLLLTLSQELVKENGPQPRRLIFLWPWLDLSLTDPLVEEVALRDPLLTVASLHAAARHYAGPSVDLKQPTLSPLYGAWAGLPELSIFAGTHDLLLADSRRLHARATAAGLPVRYFEYPEMPHGWMLMPFLPEARKAIGEVAAIIGES